ncbi:MAG: LLM class flavin-dependent oxidoreductase [Deltaproteobacteria bacterium]|nr:LLM class flavin-dependent oxidoreductase [Deltaproteobacteria bacterium]
MQFDAFFAICQTEVDGVIPDERTMLRYFMEQVQLADTLGYATAWVAETHLSCEVQKQNPGAVIPHFRGEIGVNTDILQLAHRVFATTKRINVGSAIRNILCNGGPLAHAEAVKTFLLLHSLTPGEKRKLELGFAAGRFPFANTTYGIKPRTGAEAAAWPVLKGKVFLEATEIFLRALTQRQVSSSEVTPKLLTAADFRTTQEWQAVVDAYREDTGATGTVDAIEFAPFWEFPPVGVIPFDAPLELLQLTIGSHDPAAQVLANRFWPTRVFNLSITPSATIEATHERMRQCYHQGGGPWQPSYMPRTALIFLNTDEHLSPQDQSIAAKEAAAKAIENYWRAVEGTFDERKIRDAVNNAIAGNAFEVTTMLRERYRAEERLMLWFDFNTHDQQAISNAMTGFMRDVAPALG